MEPRRADLETEALHEITRVLAYSADLNKALTSVLHVLRLVLGMENGTVSLFDPVTGEVFIEAAPEMADAERILGRLRPGEGIVGRIFQAGMPMVVPDVGAEPLFLNRTGSWRNLEEEPRAFLGVPVRDARATLGVLTVDRRHREGPISFDRDLRLLAIVAGMIGSRVRLQQLQDPMHRAGAEERTAPPTASEPQPGIVTASARMLGILETLARVAQSRATVLLRGESGTGKELFARAVHDASPRAARPFVAVNCAAIPEQLAESELFGHEKGAFTGATAAQKGRFELADGGTLFLDEIGELPLAAQAKLLRVLQERQFERLGGRRPVTVDVRLVAATNRDLEDAVRQGAFRLDLYHRISVVTVMLPALRERPEDVVPLVDHFLRQLNEENGRHVRLASDAVEEMRRCRWSGNVRQLRNCVERIVVSTAREVVGVEDLACAGCLLETLDAPREVARPAPPTLAPVASSPAPAPSSEAPPASPPPPGSGEDPDASGDDGPAPAGERERIAEALARTGFVQAKAARLLGMTVRQLGWRIRKYGITMQRY
ncbi:nif-specific transcriptional activator NifA [Anaeromyxobacter oryzae]|uniref:nif-specific transcriptional activator NifA n=1 Tax=Anaeromyxobacter oryzae TaxID=2918170 RepID=UPI0020BE93AB|nr:nif-specific transcriptional activator NifA [Anaeromyxobacter oryzae]